MSFTSTWTVGPQRGKDATKRPPPPGQKSTAWGSAPTPAAPGGAALAQPAPDPRSTERTEVESKIPLYKEAGDTYLNQYKKAGHEYLSRMGMAESGYRGQMQNLLGEADDAAKMAKSTYSDVSGRLKGVMDKAGSEAAGAMTLAQSQDPNNPVAQAFRQFYEQQAQGARQAGLADVGVMQALGAQAFGGQMSGGAPITGGQMAALMGQNQSQAGMAMANVQQRVQNLRDQGIAEGWNQTDKAYNRGLEARDFYSKSIGDYEGAGNRYQTLAQGLRSERAGYGEDILGSNTRYADAQRGYSLDTAGLQHALTTGDLDKQMAAITSEYDRRAADQLANTEASASKYAARQEKEGSIISGLLQGIGSAAGSDIRLKKNIRRITKEQAAEFIEHLNPVMYHYLEEDDSSKEHLGLIAQDIKDTELGSHIVEDRDGVYFIKRDELVGALLACVKLLGAAHAV